MVPQTRFNGEQVIAEYPPGAVPDKWLLYELESRYPEICKHGLREYTVGVWRIHTVGYKTLAWHEAATKVKKIEAMRTINLVTVPNAWENYAASLRYGVYLQSKERIKL